MPRQPAITREDLPAELNAETIRQVPLEVLRRAVDPRNDVLTPEERESLQRILREVMSETAQRVSQQMSRSDWTNVRREMEARAARGRNRGRNRANDQLRRIAQQLDAQVDAAQSIAPGVDWSFAQPDDQPAAPTDQPAATDDEATDDTTDSSAGSDTVSDLEDKLTEQTELMQVMSEIADVSHRTLDLEQQRELQNTRSFFFGFIVSVAVIIAGWAPIVAARDWSERWWIIGLTLGTCVLGGVVYGLVRRYQNRQQAQEDEHPSG